MFGFQDYVALTKDLLCDCSDPWWCHWGALNEHVFIHWDLVVFENAFNLYKIKWFFTPYHEHKLSMVQRQIIEQKVKFGQA